MSHDILKRDIWSFCRSLFLFRSSHLFSNTNYPVDLLGLRPCCCCSCPLAATRTIYWIKLQLLRACCRWKYIKIFATYSRRCARLPSSAASQITGEKKGGWKQHEALANNRRRRRTLSSLHFIARRRPIPPNTAERSLALYITRTELFGADRPPHIVNTQN